MLVPSKPIFDQDLIVEEQAQLGWVDKVVDPTLWNGEINADLVFIADFPYCSDQLLQRDIVLDVQALIDSVIRPGSHFILNCTCGIAEDAGLGAPVRVAHPDDDRILWELDVEALRPALSDELQGPGFVRLVFERACYQRAVHGLLDKIRELAGSVHPLSVCDERPFKLDGVIAAKVPDTLVVDGIQPPIHGSEALSEEILDTIGSIDWRRQPTLPAGSHVEIGLFESSEPYCVDGWPGTAWIGHWFTRHAVARAWAQWPVTRRYAVDQEWARKRRGLEVIEDSSTNHFVMVPGTSLREFDRKGENFAQLLAAGLSEGDTAPGAQVTYRSLQ